MSISQEGTNPFKFGDKELDKMHGLNQYDFHARQYDPPTGRFTTVDPHAENYFSWSPYAYCANNPMRITDPTGMDWFVNNDNGNVYYLRGVSELTNELREQYNMGEATYNNLGTDDMLGTDVIWGIYEGNSFNVLDKDFYSFGGLSRNFMDLQGYQGIEEVTIEKTISTEYSQDRSKHTRDEYEKAGNPVKTYIKKGIQIDSSLKPTKDNSSFDNYGFSNIIKKKYSATVPMGEANTFVGNLNNNSLSKSIVKPGQGDWGGLMKYLFKMFSK